MPPCCDCAEELSRLRAESAALRERVAGLEARLSTAVVFESGDARIEETDGAWCVVIGDEWLCTDGSRCPFPSDDRGDERPANMEEWRRLWRFPSSDAAFAALAAARGAR